MCFVHIGTPRSPHRHTSTQEPFCRTLHCRAVRLIGTETLDDELDEWLHTVLHFGADNNFRPTVIFASKAVANRVMVDAVRNNLQEYQKFVFENGVLQQLLGEAGAAAMRSSLFENQVQMAVSAPGRHSAYKARSLFYSPPLPNSTLTLGCSASRVLESVGDLAELGPGEYGIGGMNFPAVDGVLKNVDGSVDLLQITANPRHVIKHHALQTIVDALGATKIRLLWVAPPAEFQEFLEESFRYQEIGLLADSAAVLCDIPQYAVAFPRGDDALLVEAVKNWVPKETI